MHNVKSDRNAVNLDTGEPIFVREMYGAWRASVVLRPGVAAGLDLHAIGDTPDTAVERLRHQVALMRREALVSAAQQEAALAIAHRHSNPPVVLEPGKPVDLRPPKH